MLKRALMLMAAAVVLAGGLVVSNPRPAEATVHPPRNCYTYQPHSLRKMDFCVRNHFEGATVRPHVDLHCYARTTDTDPWDDSRCQTMTVNAWGVYVYSPTGYVYSSSRTVYDEVAVSIHGDGVPALACGTQAASFVNTVSFRTAGGTPFGPYNNPTGWWSDASPRPC
jgi:hypothetical protein